SPVTRYASSGIVGPTDWRRTGGRATNGQAGTAAFEHGPTPQAATQAQRNGTSRRGKPWRLLRAARYAAEASDPDGRFGRPICTLAPPRQAAYWGATARTSCPREVFDSLESSPEPTPELPREAPREPILTLPGALTAYIALLAVIHLVRMLLPVDIDDLVIEMFGFIPKRYDSTLLDVAFPGGSGAKVWTFVTYSLLHANLSHIGFNVLWLLPFGSALARRFGAVRFFVFMAVTAVAGALAHLVTHEHAVAPMIGASASVSGTMAAAIRFAFVRGSF